MEPALLSNRFDFCSQRLIAKKKEVLEKMLAANQHLLSWPADEEIIRVMKRKAFFLEELCRTDQALEKRCRKYEDEKIRLKELQEFFRVAILDVMKTNEKCSSLLSEHKKMVLKEMQKHNQVTNYPS